MKQGDRSSDHGSKDNPATFSAPLRFIEVNEQEVYRLKPGMSGDFTTYGERKSNGNLRVVTLLPAFAPRRLFEPDSTARMDTRTLQALCEILDGTAQVYAGQRIMATFALKE